MQHFDSDYLEGAHPAILQRLMETNMEKTSGYGTDIYCESARKKILEACGVRRGKSILWSEVLRSIRRSLGRC